MESQITWIKEDFKIERVLPINVEGLGRKITWYFAIKFFILRYNLESLKVREYTAPTVEYIVGMDNLPILIKRVYSI